MKTMEKATRTEQVLNFKADSDLGIRYDVTIKPTEDSNPEFAGDIAKGVEEIPRAKKLLLMVVADDSEEAVGAISMLGMSIADLAKLLVENKDREGYADVLAAASIAEGEIRAAERMRAVREKSRKGDLSDFLAAMAADMMRRKQE
jgi:hypothetical protein